MGANASTIDAHGGQVPADLDVLQPGRPLHLLLSSVGSMTLAPQPDPGVKSKSPASPSASEAEQPVLIVEGIASSSSSSDPPGSGPGSGSSSAVSVQECSGGAVENEGRASASNANEKPPPDSVPVPLPTDPDHEYWAALFRDFVVFDLAARAPHRAALRALCHAAAKSVQPPASPNSQTSEPPCPRAAPALALAIRAAIPRVRDYAEESAGSHIASSSSLPSLVNGPPSTSSAQAKEVLGALLLAARVLATLSDSCDVRTICLVLAADGPHDALAPRDRADIGRSALWQLLTCALDCVSRPHVHDPVAPNIALAAINLVLVAMSTQYLTPLSSATACDFNQSSSAGEGAGDSDSDPAVMESRRAQTELLTAIVDRYSRPGDVLASLLDLACDGAAHRDVLHSVQSPPSSASVSGTLSTLPGPFGERSVSDLTIPGQSDGLVSSVSRRITSALLTRSAAPLLDVPSPGSLVTAPVHFAPSSSASGMFSSLAARIPSPSGSNLFSSSMPWSPSPSSDGGGNTASSALRAPPPTPSTSQVPGQSQLVGDTVSAENAATSESSEYGLSKGGKTGSFQAGVRLAAVDAPPRVIARAPTLLGEQALALIAVLCSPREHGETNLGKPSSPVSGAPVAPHESETRTQASTLVPPSMPNPYRGALFSLHDLPQRGSGDDSTYSFSRLYETMGAWVEDARGALVVYFLVVGNRRFRTFVLARTDPDVLLVPLMAAMHARASSSSRSAPADMYIPATVALILSSDAGFCAAIDEIMLPNGALGWFEDRARLNSGGISLSCLMMLVCIRCVQQSLVSKRRVMETYLASTCASIMGNIGGTMTGISNLAADRLVAVTDFVGKRRRKAAIVAEHAKEMTLSAPPVRNGLPSRGISTHFACPLEPGVSPVSSPPSSANANASDGQSSGQREALVDGGKQRVSSRSTQTPGGVDEGLDIVFPLCGVEASDAECEISLTELLCTMLETITSILRSRSSVSVNRHLMYSLLHRESVFDKEYIVTGAVRARVLADRIRKVISFFSDYLDDLASTGANASVGRRPASGGIGGQSPGDRVGERLAFSLSGAGISDKHALPQSGALSSGLGLSIDRVFDVIDRYGRMLPRDILFSLPEVRYAYCESQSPSHFFLPYAWVLAMRESSLQWDPAQFPDARIPLAHSVFHPPRPSHGTARM